MYKSSSSSEIIYIIYNIYFIFPAHHETFRLCTYTYKLLVKIIQYFQLFLITEHSFFDSLMPPLMAPPPALLLAFKLTFPPTDGPSQNPQKSDSTSRVALMGQLVSLHCCPEGSTFRDNRAPILWESPNLKWNWTALYNCHHGCRLFRFTNFFFFFFCFLTSCRRRVEMPKRLSANCGN